MAVSKRGALTVSIVVLLLFGAMVPAQAAAGVGLATARSTNGLWLATAACSAEVGATTDGQSLTFVVEGSAQAEGPGVATSINCVVKQAGNTIGGCSLALPGSVSACASTARGNISLGLLSVCAEVFVLYLDGSTASSPPCS